MHLALCLSGDSYRNLKRNSLKKEEEEEEDLFIFHGASHLGSESRSVWWHLYPRLLLFLSCCSLLTDFILRLTIW